MKTSRKQKSQIAVIITFVIAVIILLAAVFINITKVSQSKMTISQAVDKAALSLASQLGSISHSHQVKVLGGGGTPRVIDNKEVLESCSTNPYILLAALIAIGIFIAVPYVSLPTLAVGGAGVITGVLIIMGLMNTKFQEMTDDNALRESALFLTLASIQTDNVLLRADAPGVFYEDRNNNGIRDAGEQSYDLGAFMPEMKNQPTVSRFLAWYNSNRLVYLNSNNTKMAVEIDKFIEGNISNSARDGLKEFIEIDSNTVAGDIGDLTFLLVPPGYTVTCSASSTPPCPVWVKNSTNGELRMVRTGAVNGFLEFKFKSLLQRLESAYNLGFCSGSNCTELDTVVSDFKEDFLPKIKEVVNLPVTKRLNGLMQWFPLFYDVSKHKIINGTVMRDSIDNPFNTAKEFFDNSTNKTAFNTAYSYDAYLRLNRDSVYVESWIDKLNALDNAAINATTPGIRAVIASKHGECTWGRGPVVTSSTCDTTYACSKVPCGEHYCGESYCCNYCCYNPQQCAWEGTYYTCCDQTMRVCTSGEGDLYGVVPGWCASRGRHDPCSSSCSGCNIHAFDCGGDARNFMGQLSWNNTTGLTEVGQATSILSTFKTNIDILRMVIGTFADKVEKFYNITNNTIDRNETIYGWQDKNQFAHFVQVNITGYPEKLPFVTESSTFNIPPQKCRQLNYYQGNFTMTASRYDQDQPTAIAEWKLRRRKQVNQTEYNVTNLTAAVTEIQNTGVSNTTRPYVDAILANYAIKSTSQAHYGPAKSDIYIMNTSQ